VDNFGKGTFLGNLSALALGKLGGDMAAFGLFVVISRYFGEDGVGQYSFAMAATGFFMVTADFGLEFLSTREMSKLAHEELASYTSRILAIRIYQSLISLLLLAALSVVLPFSNDYLMIILVIGIYQILYKGLDGILAVFIAREDMTTAAVLSASLRILACLTSALLILLGTKLSWSLSVFPLFATLQLWLAYRIVGKKIGRIKPRATLFEIKAIVKAALPFATSEFLRQLSTRSDVIILGLIIGAGAAGIYNAAFRIIFMLSLLSYLGGLAIYPRISRIFDDDQEAFKNLYSTYLGIAILVGTPASIGLTIIASELINLIFGAAMASSSLVLQVLSALVLLTTLKFILQMFMMAADIQTLMVRSQWFSTLFGLITLFLVVPAYGVVGAALSVIFAELILVAFYGKYLKSLVGIPRVFKRLLMAVLGSVIAVSIIQFLQVDSMIFIIPLAIIIYVPVILCSSEIRNTELKMLLGTFTDPEEQVDI